MLDFDRHDCCIRDKVEFSLENGLRLMRMEMEESSNQVKPEVVRIALEAEIEVKSKARNQLCSIISPIVRSIKHYIILIRL